MIITLIIAQIIYYFVVSAAVLALAVFLAMLIYRLVRLAKELQEISEHLHEASAEAEERIHDILDRLSMLPILSFFLRRPKGREDHEHRKGRKRISE